MMIPYFHFVAFLPEAVIVIWVLILILVTFVLPWDVPRKGPTDGDRLSPGTQDVWGGYGERRMVVHRGCRRPVPQVTWWWG